MGVAADVVEPKVGVAADVVEPKVGVAADVVEPKVGVAAAVVEPNAGGAAPVEADPKLKAPDPVDAPAALPPNWNGVAPDVPADDAADC